jgi:fumarylacetoacetase
MAAPTPAPWLAVPRGSDFPIENLPYGVGTHGERPPHVVTRVGGYVVSLGALALAGLLDGVLTPSGHAPEPAAVFAVGSLNPFMAQGPAVWAAVRERLTELFTNPKNENAVKQYLVPAEEVLLHMPFEVADYVDFYSSEHHAVNLGRLFRPDADEPLVPNWKHLPIGYHGRSGTVVPSGTPIVRPAGQRKAPSDAEPRFGPSVRLDIEAEVGFVVGAPSALGSRVHVDDFLDHVFGVVLVNDWSARDIQAWEYQPLGPFLGKSFATSVSPWVVPLAALADARVAPPHQDPFPLPYLQGETWGYDLTLEIRLNGTPVSYPPFAGLYWTPAQQLAHMTVNGASLRTGDLYASGTVSGPLKEQRGSLIELTWNGAEPIALADGMTRGFLVDGDTVAISASAPGPNGSRIGFGEVVGTVQSALPTADLM